VYGDKQSYAFEFRNYDARLGRFWSVDPLWQNFPWNSSYAFAENDVIRAKDLEGTEKLVVTVSNNPPTSVIRTATAPNILRYAAQTGVAVRHPIASTKAGWVKRGGTNISSISGRIARHMEVGGNMSKGHGSESNAFRHALWQATIASQYGEEISKKIGNAHEGIRILESANVDFSKSLPTDSEAADDIVDFLNNEIGRNIAKGLGENASSLDIAKEVLRVQRDEGLWNVNFDDKRKPSSISRNKISQEQYDNAIKILNTLDNKGFNEEDRRSLQDGN
jgi:hypothetical protein